MAEIAKLEILLHVARLDGDHATAQRIRRALRELGAL